MIDKKSIIKMSKHVFHKSQGYPDRRLMHPQRDWEIGVLFFVAIVILGSITAGNIFVTYKNSDVISGDPGESIPQYREVLVKDALELYRARSASYELLREDTVSVMVQEVASSIEQTTQVDQFEQVEEGY